MKYSLTKYSNPKKNGNSSYKFNNRNRKGRFHIPSPVNVTMIKLAFLIFILFGSVAYADSINRHSFTINNDKFSSTSTIPEVKLDFKPLTVLSEESLADTPETKEKAIVVNHTARGLESDIEAYIRSKDWNDEHALLIARCESGLNPYAFNPETEPKRKHLTRWSSCGIFQINSPICQQSDNVLYSYKHNIDTAYKMWTTRGFQPWINCSAKYNIKW